MQRESERQVRLAWTTLCRKHRTCVKSLKLSNIQQPRIKTERCWTPAPPTLNQLFWQTLICDSATGSVHFLLTRLHKWLWYTVCYCFEGRQSQLHILDLWNRMISRKPCNLCTPLAAAKGGQMRSSAGNTCGQGLRCIKCNFVQPGGALTNASRLLMSAMVHIRNTVHWNILEYISLNIWWLFIGAEETQILANTRKIATTNKSHDMLQQTNAAWTTGCSAHVMSAPTCVSANSMHPCPTSLSDPGRDMGDFKYTRNNTSLFIFHHDPNFWQSSMECWNILVWDFWNIHDSSWFMISYKRVVTSSILHCPFAWLSSAMRTSVSSWQSDLLTSEIFTAEQPTDLLTPKGLVLSQGSWQRSTIRKWRCAQNQLLFLPKLVLIL